MDAVRTVAVALTALLATAVAEAGAHDIWLTTAREPAATRVVVNYGHPGHQSPPLADKVLDLSAITAAGEVSLSKGLEPVVRDGRFVLVSPPLPSAAPALVAARYDNGFWVQTADGTYRNSSRLLYPDAKQSVWSMKFAKSLTGAGAPFDRVLGHELEIVPLADPAALASGDTLRVRVLFHGAPLPGAEVELGDGITAVSGNDIPAFATGPDGIAALTIAKAGPQVLSVDHRGTSPRAPDLAAADTFNATLHFVPGGR